MKKIILISVLAVAVLAAGVFSRSVIKVQPVQAEAQANLPKEFSDFGVIELPTQERTYYGMIGDLNGDGKPDVVLVGAGKVIILKNNMQGK